MAKKLSALAEATLRDLLGDADPNVRLSAVVVAKRWQEGDGFAASPSHGEMRQSLAEMAEAVRAYFAQWRVNQFGPNIVKGTWEGLDHVLDQFTND